MTPPWVVPPGFYYHYKRDTAADVDVGAYEVLGVGVNSETEDLEVEYRPIYKEGAMFLREKSARCFHRKLLNFLDKVRKGNGLVQRFTRITDEDTINRLEYFRDQYYHKAARS
jgi:hypothetical protein